MWKIRTFVKKYVCTIVLIMFGSCILVYTRMFNQQDKYDDNKLKIQKMERSINSNFNKEECIIPNLPINSSDIMKFYTTGEKLDCGDSDKDWVVCEKSICFVKPQITSQKGEVTCTYTDLIRKSDYRVKYGNKFKTKEVYVLKNSDYVKVSCVSENSERWFGIVIGIREKLQRELKQTSLSLYNVLIFGFDSLSRNAFIRKLPKTYKYLINDLEGNVLTGYNIIGDGTPQALVPILTGKTELELPETRKRMQNSNYVNSYPMIWKNYEHNGYVTSFNEDMPKYGTFTYRMKGFLEQPTDHYMRTFYLEIENYLNSFGKFCIGNQAGHKVLLDYTKNFMTKYIDVPRFIFSFHGDLSHDAINLIGAADDDVLNWLSNLNQKGILQNTIVILMSDHGNRFADVRNTLQGKQEERLPFFSFVFPESFKIRYHKEFTNFKNNIEKLTTPFDIHETLLDILRIQSLQVPQKDEKKLRSISLFKEIPKSRSCSDAYIEPHWCSCLNWQTVNLTKFDDLDNIVNSFLGTINNYTKSHRSICEHLKPKEIVWVLRLTPHNELLQFRQNKDIDGFLPDLSSEMKIYIELYQIKMIVSPGDSIFEASVSHNLSSNTFYTSLSQISRINKYGNQAYCIYNKNPELRKYCYCRGNQFKFM